MNKSELQDYADHMKDDEKIFALLISAKDVHQWFKDNDRTGECPEESVIYAALEALDSNFNMSDTMHPADELDDLCESLALPKVTVEVLGGVASVTRNPDRIKVQIIDHDNH
jgi:hypothetical protein